MGFSVGEVVAPKGWQIQSQLQIHQNDAVSDQKKNICRVVHQVLYHIDWRRVQYVQGHRSTKLSSGQFITKMSGQTFYIETYSFDFDTYSFLNIDCQ